MPWISNEDEAVKAKLSGLTVGATASADVLPVAVRFTVPEDEYADLTYPLITLMHAQIERDPERESRGIIELSALPEGVDPTLGPYFAEVPIPYNIDYQVVLYTRLLEHRTPLLGILATRDYLPERFGYLQVTEDDTVRRLDLLGGPELNSGRDSNGKRLFTATWRVRVSTELYLLETPAVFPTVTTISITVADTVPGSGN